MRKHLLHIGACLFVACIAPVHADVSFVFDYTQAPEFTNGVGNVEKREALEDAATTVGSWLDEQADIEVIVRSYDVDSPFLAAAIGRAPPRLVSCVITTVIETVVGPVTGTVTTICDRPPGFYPNYPMTEIQTGADLNTTNADAVLDVNFFYDYDYGDDVAADKKDFKSVIMHELLHVLGLESLSAINSPATPSDYTSYDEFLSDKDGLSLIDASFALDMPRWESNREAGTADNAGVYFNGPNAIAANGGQPVRLHTPTSFDVRTSISHLFRDFERPFDNHPWQIMTPGTGDGPSVRRLSAIERGMLIDLGYRMKPLDDAPIRISVCQTSLSGARFQFTGDVGTSFFFEGSHSLLAPDWQPLRQVFLSPSGGVTVLMNETLQFFRATR